MARGLMRSAGARPTLDTVAAAAGVSRMTVSNAYNRPDQLSAATRERVLAAADRLGYPGPDPTAASLRLGRTGTVGVVLSEQLSYAFTDPGMVTILHGIAAGLSSAGNALLLVPSSGVEERSLLRTSMVDGLVLCSLTRDDPAVAVATERQIPIVTVGTPKLPGWPRVGPDNRRAGAMAAEHLRALGHHRFAVVTTDPATGRPGFDERAAGFADASGAARVVHWLARDNSRGAGRAAAEQALAARDARRPTAVFAVTDILALGVLDAAAAAGVPVPAALSVVGFDDIPEASTSSPPLTTIAHDLFGQGREAARLALALVAGEPARVRRAPAELVVRASTAAPQRRSHRGR